MGDLFKYKTFFYDGNPKREAENFQQYVFQDLDLSKVETPISFFRSDFREVKIQRMKFWKNEFERADFTDSYITESVFEESHFGTDFINVYFNNVTFKNDSFRSCTFLRCLFDSCQFEGGEITDSTMQACSFINCTLDHIKFKENTCDDLFFQSTKFLTIDLSNMTAKDLQFLDCHSDSLKIDPDYLGSYLINNDFLQEVEFIYRGHLIDMPSDKGALLESLIHLWRKTNRFFELFNLLILYRHYKESPDNYIDVFAQILTKLMSINHPSLKTYNLKGIVKCLSFYSETGYLLLEEVLSVAKKLEDTINTSEDFEILGIFLSFRQKLDSLLISEPLRARNLNANVVFNLREQDDSETQLEKWILEVSSYLVSEGIIPQNHSYNKISIEKGSIILTVTVSFSVVLYLIKSILNLRSKIKRDNMANKFYSISLSSFENSIKKETSSKKKIEIIKAYQEVLAKDQTKQIDENIASLATEIGGLEKIINRLDVML